MFRTEELIVDLENNARDCLCALVTCPFTVAMPTKHKTYLATTTSSSKNYYKM